MHLGDNLGLVPDFSTLELKTDRLRLTPMTEADAPALFEILSDPVVTRYWSSPPWTDMSQALAMIERDQKATAAGEQIRLGLHPTEDPTLIGFCTLFAFDFSNRRAEVGYALARHAWRQGFLQEALTALIDYGFVQLDLNRIEADTDPRNEASKRSLEKLGFVNEGFLRERWHVNGEVCDTDFYGLLRKDWRLTKAAE